MATVSHRKEMALLICPELADDIEVRELVIARQAAAITRLKAAMVATFPLVNDLVAKLDPERKEGRT